ncbi:MAG: hypothetical protein ACW991_02860, partial [Candidatus Hodarchaeales archaeon]
MGSAKVITQEIDLSTRVPTFPGVYGGIVIPAKKGPVGERILVTSDSQLLKFFTLDEKIEVGYDNSYFSALAYLEKSNKLWVSRADKNSLYGGVVIKSFSSTTDNYALTSGLSDPTSFVFDASPDVEGVAEVTPITCVADVSDSLDGTFFKTYDSAGSVGWWFDVDDSGTTAPAGALACDRQVEITTIVTDDADTVVAGKVATAMDADSQYSAAAVGALVTATDAVEGDRTDATAETSGFTIGT